MVGRPAPANRPAAAPLSPHERSTALKNIGPAVGDHQSPPEDAVVATPPTLEDGPPLIDEAAESAFLAEAHERGEVVAPKPASAEPVEETSAKPLPPLDELVQRIPAEVRDVLDDLFRARFVSVKRVPKKALKPE